MILKNKQIDRISCGFYENTPFDKQLLEILNRLSANPRIRGQKLKELAWEYIKLTMPEEINKSEKNNIPKKEKIEKTTEAKSSTSEKKQENGFQKVTLTMR